MANHQNRAKPKSRVNPLSNNAPSWVPVRRGAIYCSPACGFLCTHAEFVTATKRAAALVKSLGKGWTPDVWENTGRWHYSAAKGCARVMAHYHWNPKETFTGFTCDFSEVHQFIGEHATDPVKAFRDSLRLAREFQKKLAAEIEEVA